MGAYSRTIAIGVVAALGIFAHAARAVVNVGSGNTGATQARSGGSGSAGTFGVGSTTTAPDLFTGVLQQSIPLEVVPGRHGMQPNVVLNYNSANGNGPVGIGWELELGHIQRRTKGGLSYPGNDYVLRSGTSSVDLVLDPNNPETYHPVVESDFQRIKRVLVGAAWHWEITDRLGTTYFYGQDDASRQYDPANTAVVFKWCLDRVVDQHRNYLTVSYVKDSNAIYPSRIDYTGNEPDLAPTNAVIFEWVFRGDRALDYTAQFSQPVLTWKRLDHVDVQAAGLLVRRYQLGYTASGATGRSLLASLTQLGKDGTSALPAITFDWSGGPVAWNVKTAALGYGNWSTSGDRIRVADLDGDGYEDVVFGPEDSTSNWYALWGSPNGLVSRSSFPWTSGVFTFGGPMSPGDVNGNGRQDLVLGPGGDTGSIQVIRDTIGTYSTWGGGTSVADFQNCLPSRIVNPYFCQERVWVADLTGDGLVDVLMGPDINGTFFLSINTGTSFQPVIQAGAAAEAMFARVNVADVTGDGLADIVIGPTSSGGWLVMVNTGNGFASKVPWATGYSSFSSQDNAKFVRFMDVNGDGKADVVIGPDNTSAHSGDWYVMLSTGTRFDDRGVWFSGPNANYSAYHSSEGALRIRPFDWNGDGLTDILLGPDGSGNWFLLQSVGWRFESRGQVLAFFAGGSWGDPTVATRVRIGDFNGDGRMDILSGPDGNGNWFHAFGAARGYPDLLTGIHNGYGSWTTIEYAPSTQFTNTQLPLAIQVVRKVTTCDGNGVCGVSEYSYDKGYYQFAGPVLNREFRGFASATVTGPAWPNGARLVSTTYFHQGTGLSPETDDPHVTDAYMKGKPYLTSVGDTASTSASNTYTSYTDLAAPAGVHFNPISAVRANFCAAPSQCARETRTVFHYDAYGNVVREDQYGDTSDGTLPAADRDDRTLIRSFNPNTTAWVLALPHKETLYAGTGAPVPASADRISETRYSYDEATACSSDPATIIPARGDVTCIARWLNGGVDPATALTYDSYGNRIAERDANGNLTQFAYDTGGRTFLIATTTPATANAPSGLTSTTRYYGIDGVLWTSLSDGSFYGLVESTIDFNGATSTSTYDVVGRQVRSTDPDGFVTTWSYNSLGTPGSQNARLVTPVGTSETYFDGLGRTIKTRRQGSSTGCWIDTRTAYLPTGMVSQSSAPFFEGAPAGCAAVPPRWTTFGYDVRGRVVSVTKPDSTVATACVDDMTGAAGFVDENLHRKRQTIDVHGRIKEVNEYLDTTTTCSTSLDTPYATTKYHYDLMGRPIETLNAVDSPLSTVYDTVGRRLVMSDPDMGTWYYGYDGAGNLTYQKNSNGKAVNVRYDAFNRPLIKHYCANPAQSTCAVEPTNSSKDVFYTYDLGSNAKGRLAQILDPSGSTAYVYDPLGRVTSTTQGIGTSGTYTTQRRFDLTTRRLSTIIYPDYPTNTEVSYSYDANGYLRQVSEPARVHATFSGYDEAGRPRTCSLGDGTTLTYTWNDTNKRLDRIVSAANGTTLFDLQYTYYPNGNVKFITDAILSNPSQTFKYDGLDRLESAASAGYTPNNAIPPGGLTYTYDPVRVHVLNSTSDGRTFVHDGNGNRKSDGVRRIAWNEDNRPVCIALAGTSCDPPVSGSPIVLTYDGTGTRVKKEGPAGTVLYVGKLYECAGGTCTRYIYAGPSRIAAVTTGQPPMYVYFHGDHSGSLRKATNNGSVVESIFYQPFGYIASDVGAGDSRYKFTGQEWDAETSLYNFGARLYDPLLGRFLSPDSIVQDGSDPQVLNRYAYARNNPLVYTDPSGRFIQFALYGALIGGLLGGVESGNALGVLKGAAVGAAGGFYGGFSGNVVYQALGGGPLAGFVASVVGGATGGAMSGAAGAIANRTNITSGIVQGAMFGAISGAISGGMFPASPADGSVASGYYGADIGISFFAVPCDVCVEEIVVNGIPRAPVYGASIGFGGGGMAAISATPFAFLIRLLENGERRLIRRLPSKAEAVIARQGEKDVAYWTRQDAIATERAAGGGAGELRVDKGHQLRNGDVGKPHVHTEGMGGHGFWGGVLDLLDLVLPGPPIIIDPRTGKMVGAEIPGIAPLTHPDT